MDCSKAMRMIVIRTLRQAGWRSETFLEEANGKETLQSTHCASLRAKSISQRPW
jgi:hypothetical protein